MAPYSGASKHNTYMVKQDSSVINLGAAMNPNSMNTFMGAYPSSSQMNLNQMNDIVFPDDVIDGSIITEFLQSENFNIDETLNESMPLEINFNNENSFDSLNSCVQSVVKSEPVFMPLGDNAMNQQNSLIQTNNVFAVSNQLMADVHSQKKSSRRSASMEISYGPLVVRPRKTPAPTLANGRKSKYEILTNTEEEMKRKLRRERNRIAANKCKNKRTEIETTLEKRRDELRSQNEAIKQEHFFLQEQKRKLMEVIENHSSKRLLTEHQMNAIRDNSQYNYQSSNYSFY